MEKFLQTIFACVFLLSVAQVNGYSKYGRTCKDIGCRPMERCVMVQECDSEGIKCNYPTCVKDKSIILTCETKMCAGGQHCEYVNEQPTCIDDPPTIINLYALVVNIFADNNGGELRYAYRRKNTGNNESSMSADPKTSANSGYPASSRYPTPSGNDNSVTRTNAQSVSSGYPSFLGSSYPSLSGYPSSSGSGYPKSSGYPSSLGSGYPSNSDYPSCSGNGYRASSDYPNSGYPPGSSSTGYPSSGANDNTIRRSCAASANARYPNSADGYPSSAYPSNGGYPQQNQGQSVERNDPSQSHEYPASDGYQGQHGQYNNRGQFSGSYSQQGYQQPAGPGYYDNQRSPNGHPGGDYPNQQQHPKKPSITDQITNYLIATRSYSNNY